MNPSQQVVPHRSLIRQPAADHSFAFACGVTSPLEIFVKLDQGASWSRTGACDILTTRSSEKAEAMEDAELRRHAGGLSRRDVATLALGAFALPIAGPAFGRGIEGPATAEDEKFMRLALEEAALGDYPFGTVIVSGGEVLARGRNLGIKEKDPTAHGEMVAIRNFLAAPWA